MDWIHLTEFLQFSTRVITFATSCLVSYTPIPTREITFVTSHFVTTNRTMKITCGFLFGFLHTKPFKKKKEFFLTGKNLLPFGANSFLLEWPLFRRVVKTSLLEFPPLKVCQLTLNCCKYFHNFLSYLSCTMRKRALGIYVNRNGPD